MVSKLAVLSALFAAASATIVQRMVYDISGGLGRGNCAAYITFDDSSPAEVQGCPMSSDGITINTDRGALTVKCDVDKGGPNGANQCINERVVCRSGCCGTVKLVYSDAPCTVPNMCTGGDCLMCAEMVSLEPTYLTC